MTLQDLGSIGEMVGAIGVVVTLLYLTKQIRLNTIAMDDARDNRRRRNSARSAVWQPFTETLHRPG